MDKTDMDAVFMRRCLQLASLGRGYVSPNPMVGAVVVHRGRIIGEGYHRCYGQPHAEVNAINSVRDAGLLPECTLYVSLEPCSHYGKTPPCADLIIEKQIPRIVIGCQDPFSQVAGRGIQKLRDAGKRSDSRRTGERMQVSDPALHYFQYAAPPLYHTKMGRIG